MNVLYNIMGALLRFIYEFVQTIMAEPKSISYYAISILVITAIYKMVTIPITFKSTEASQKMQELQPELDALKRKYSYDPQILSQKQMELYKERNVKMSAGCLPMLLQMIIMLALYGVIQNPAKYLFDNAEQIHAIAKNFFWIPDLTLADPFMYGLPLFNALTQLAMSFLTVTPAMQQNEQMKSQQMMMRYFMPVMIFFMMKNFASGLILYWCAGNIIEIVIRLILKVVKGNKGEDSNAVGYKDSKNRG